MILSLLSFVNSQKLIPRLVVGFRTSIYNKCWVSDYRPLPNLPYSLNLVDNLQSLQGYNYYIAIIHSDAGISIIDLSS